MKNIISLDISKNSTGLCIKSNLGLFFYNYTTKDEKYKWIKFCKDIIKTRHYKFELYENYSDNEINNLKLYNKIVDYILIDIENSTDSNEDYICLIEGYSFSKNTNSILNLVEIGQSIRYKIMEIFNPYFIIKSPKTIKLDIGTIIYGKSKIIKNKGMKNEHIIFESNKNPFGISYGSFDKCDMYQCILDSNFNDYFSNFLKENKDKLYNRKTIVKPAEDVIDSYILNQLYFLKYEKELD